MEKNWVVVISTWQYKTLFLSVKSLRTSNLLTATRRIVYRCVHLFIILLYLLDINNSSNFIFSFPVMEFCHRRAIGDASRNPLLRQLRLERRGTYCCCQSYSSRSIYPYVGSDWQSADTGNPLCTNQPLCSCLLHQHHT